MSKQKIIPGSFPLIQDIKDILQLVTSEYVIFLSNRFMGWFCRNLRSYFSKYNIVYLIYNDSKKIFDQI